MNVDEAAPVRVAILVPTYRRPDWLETLLFDLDEAHAALGDPPAPGVATLATGHRSAHADSGPTRWHVRVFVADNDPDRQAGAAVVRRLASRLGVEVEALLEPQPGVSSVRNALVARARDWRARYLLMIDDDERPSRGWIAAMLDCAARYEADIVSGPVRPDFAEPPPRWIIEHALFDDAPASTGTPATVQRTGNTLLRTRLLENTERFPDDEWFSRRLGQVGGEDSHLIERLVRDGARHVWCEEAVVHERVPAERATFDYLAARAYRSGNAGMLYRSMLHPGIAWGGLRLGKSALLAVRWLVLGHRLLVPGRRELHRLDRHVVRGRLAAHRGRFGRFY